MKKKKKICWSSACWCCFSDLYISIFCHPWLVIWMFPLYHDTVRTLCHQISVLSEELSIEGNPPSQWLTLWVCRGHSLPANLFCRKWGALQISCCLFCAMDQCLEYVYILSDSFTAWTNVWATDSAHSSHDPRPPSPTAQRDHKLSPGKNNRRVWGMKLGWGFL